MIWFLSSPWSGFRKLSTACKSDDLWGRSFITPGGRGFGGGVQSSKKLDFGGSILKMHKMCGGWNIKTKGWPSMQKLSNCIMIKENPRFLQKKTKKFASAVLCQQQKCYPYKAWPRNLSAISTTKRVACMYAHMPMHTAEIWTICRDFSKVFLSLNCDKYFAL